MQPASTAPCSVIGGGATAVAAAVGSAPSDAALVAGATPVASAMLAAGSGATAAAGTPAAIGGLCAALPRTWTHECMRCGCPGATGLCDDCKTFPAPVSTPAASTRAGFGTKPGGALGAPVRSDGGGGHRPRGDPASSHGTASEQIQVTLDQDVAVASTEDTNAQMKYTCTKDPAQSVRNRAAALKKGLAGKHQALQTATEESSTLPLLPSELQVASPKGRAAASLPIQCDMEDRELQFHFQAVADATTQRMYRTDISPEMLHMKLLRPGDGRAYIAIAFQSEFTPQLPIQKPHITLAFECAVSDWNQWWRLKSEMSCYVSARQISCFFEAAQPGKNFSFVLSERCELAVLCRVLQEIIEAFHQQDGPVPLMLASMLHMTFNKVGENTV